jgi:hypothetical protein
MSLQVACGHPPGPTPPADYAPPLRSPWRAARGRYRIMLVERLRVAVPHYVLRREWLTVIVCICRGQLKMPVLPGHTHVAEINSEISSPTRGDPPTLPGDIYHDVEIKRKN